MDILDRSFSFTQHGQIELERTVQDPSFPTRDAPMILETLKNAIGLTPFSEYLKRYVYLKSGMMGSYYNVPLEKYRSTIVEAFRDTGTPCSMKPIKTPLATRVNSWLHQTLAGRDVVLLLGFGLSMSVSDVNEFLTNACHDHLLDPENPLDAICTYCYERGYRFAKMKELWRLYQDIGTNVPDRSLLLSLQPAGRPRSMLVAEEDYQLLSRLSGLSRGTRSKTLQDTQDTFFRLYRLASRLIAKPSPANQPESGGGLLTPHEMEDVLCAAIPRDHHGNLVSELHSSLQRELAGKRFSRQHVSELIKQKVQPNRYDLITLQFLIAAETCDPSADSKATYLSFIQETDRMLERCGYGPLYLADPYECFILMCILSIDPLGTYSDVFELSYQEPREVV